MSGEKWPKDAATYQVETNPVGEVAWVPDDDDGCEYSCAIVEVVDRQNVAVVATFPRDPCIGPEIRASVEAIARLYASAPRLYAALFTLVDEAEPNEHKRPVMRAAREALAAARGEATT